MKRLPHRVNPKIPPEWEKYFRGGKKLLDPFAGFGSIPLEGLRLGLDVTAVELLPTTYVFLKAVLDYPKKFGKPPLVKDVERWSNWITEQLKNDPPEIRELYDDDVAVYIGTWEVKCPPTVDGGPPRQSATTGSPALRTARATSGSPT
ncbi:hypothetical protein [Thermococcus peptonophilus]|uniref:hypothetical protein n=1 Tax=Thermococcus peptonophilus TaxID=53952 RepID=UPI000AB04E10